MITFTVLYLPKLPGPPYPAIWAPTAERLEANCVRCCLVPCVMISRCLSHHTHEHVSVLHWPQERPDSR